MKKNISYKIPMYEHDFKGILVIVEGMDGTGKSSTLRYIYDKLKNDNYKVIHTFFPTTLVRQSTLFKKFIYENKKDEVDFEAFQLLHIADRLQHSEKFIKARLREGNIVLCDRYVYSTLVTIYSYRNNNFDWFNLISKRIIKPDLAFVLNSDIDTCLSRIRARIDEKDIEICNLSFKKGLELYKAVAIDNNAEILCSNDKTSLEINSYKIIKEIQQLWMRKNL